MKIAERMSGIDTRKAASRRWNGTKTSQWASFYEHTRGCVRFSNALV